MTDIVERLRLFVPHCEDPNDYLEDELLFLEAADQIERLRGALERLAELDEFVCGKPQTIEEVMNYTQFVARTALGEKE